MFPSVKNLVFGYRICTGNHNAYINKHTFMTIKRASIDTYASMELNRGWQLCHPDSISERALKVSDHPGPTEFG